MKNSFDVSEGVVRIAIPNRSGVVRTALIDEADLDLVASMNGRLYACVQPRRDNAYVMAHDETGRPVYLHRWLTGAAPGFDVDHINHDGLDNRRANLRVVTRAANQLHRAGANSNSRSGVLGVSWFQRDQRWRAFVRRDGKCIFLGTFKNLDEAAAVAQEARR